MNKNYIRSKFTTLFDFFTNHRKHFIITTVILVFLSCYSSFSKYISSITGTANASVAKMYYSVDLEESNASFNNKVLSYYFNINNFDDNDNLNEVLSHYYLKPIVPTDSNLSAINFDFKLYYKNDLGVWVEILSDTTGSYVGYYKGYDNLNISAKTRHSYRLDVTISDDIYIESSYDFNIDLIVLQ